MPCPENCVCMRVLTWPSIDPQIVDVLLTVGMWTGGLALAWVFVWAVLPMLWQERAAILRGCAFFVAALLGLAGLVAATQWVFGVATAIVVTTAASFAIYWWVLRWAASEATA